MSPRPRAVEDDVILDAAIKVLSRLGPDRMTLADVGGEVGLSAATLVQRFGSKRALMLALLQHFTGDIDVRFESAMAEHESPLEGIFAAAANRAGPLDDHVTLAHRLSFYLSQMEDPEFRALALENSSRAIAGFKRLLDAAIEAGELIEGPLDTTQMAETIYAMELGSLVSWSVAAKGSLEAKIRRDLDVLLRPFRKGPRRASARQVQNPETLSTAPRPR